MVAVTGGVSLITAFCLFSLVVWPIKIRRCEFKKKKVGGGERQTYDFTIVLFFYQTVSMASLCLCCFAFV